MSETILNLDKGATDGRRRQKMVMEIIHRYTIK
jgi:hypothetical protein